MSDKSVIQSMRLELIPITEETCIADMTSSELLGRHLHARIPESWPPALMTPETYGQFLTLLKNPEGSRLIAFYWVTRGNEDGEYRTLIGSGGFVLDDGGIPEIGYSVLDEFQHQGYATEAVHAMIEWISLTCQVPLIRASTYPNLPGSVRVLEKNAFHQVGGATEEGIITFERSL
jgi:RimJ/RimL family protein N-acetyltransferase